MSKSLPWLVRHPLLSLVFHSSCRALAATRARSQTIERVWQSHTRAEMGPFTHTLQMDAFQQLTRLMYLFHLCASGVSAAVNVAPTIDQPISLQMFNVDTSVPPTYTSLPASSSLQHLLFLALGCSPEQGAYSSYQNEKWMERLAALCHRTSVVCSPSQHAEGLFVVTDQMAAASDDCNYAAYIYQENDLSRSLSLSTALMCHMAAAIH